MSRSVGLGMPSLQLGCQNTNGVFLPWTAQGGGCTGNVTSSFLQRHCSRLRLGLWAQECRRSVLGTRHPPVDPAEARSSDYKCRESYLRCLSSIAALHMRIAGITDALRRSFASAAQARASVGAWQLCIRHCPDFRRADARRAAPRTGTKLEELLQVPAAAALPEDFGSQHLGFWPIFRVEGVTGSARHSHWRSHLRAQPDLPGIRRRRRGEVSCGPQNR